jgi:hypothetical protein
MPGYKGHLTGGFILFLSLLLVVRHFYHPSICTIIEWLLCTLLGSLFPDIDVKSKGQKWFYWFLFLLFICLFVWRCYFILSLLGIISLLPMLVKHRGLFHKSWFILLLGAGVLILIAMTAPRYLSAATFDIFFFLVGALSHLWLDLGLRRMLRW